MVSAGTKLSGVADDTVNCFFFIPGEKQTERSDYWKMLCNDINEVVDRLSMNYLWHKEKFQVYLPILREESDGVPDHLCSCTSFGDNVDDEWFIVYLIYELTNHFADLIVQVQDNDGNFLLIEAADYLPKWMNPDNTDNRVFINKGEIHILPPCIAELEKELSIKKAIDVIVNHSQETKAAPEIQKAILKMISPYPAKIEDSMHQALIKVPLEIAAVLKLKPELISPIVNAYCYHDIIDAKCCKNVKLEDDSICIKVNFTKCLYAMLTHSKLLNTGTTKMTLNNDKRVALGFKILCGYSIIMNESSDILSTRSYKRFLSNLKENGYFKENLEGSKEYTLLQKKANEYYASLLCPINENVCSKIKKITATEEFKKLLHGLKNCDESTLGEDSDEWLNIDSEQLNDLLISRYGQQAKFKNDVTPQGMADQVSSFLNQMSDFEGVELNDSKIDDNDVIEFDIDLFSKSLKNILNFVMPENGADNVTLQDDFSSDDGDIDINEQEDADIDLDRELKETLSSDIIRQTVTENKNSIYDNFIHGIREEGPSGPTGNLLRSMANRKDFLDSDDDE